MAFTDLFIRRPVLSIVFSLIIFLVGLRAYVELPVRQYPLIQPSIINVTTTYPGANAALMEGFVSTPIESALAGAEGIDYITSTNTQGKSSVTAHFKLGQNINKALTEVSNQVASIRNVLPKEINAPIVAKDDPNAQPIIFMTFFSKTMSGSEISDYLLRVIKPQFATLSGVGRVDIFGERPYAMRLWLDPQRMVARDVTAEDVQNALTRNNVQSAAGRVISDWQEFDVNVTTDLRTPAEFDNLIIRSTDATLVRLKDIGSAELGSTPVRASATLDGVPAKFIAIVPQSAANPIEIAKQVRALLPHIQEELPGDLKASIDYDASQFISQSINEVYKTILEATIFVVIVIFLFLGSIRSVIIPIVTIPLSLIGVCVIMLAFGYSLNTMTLLAAVLAIGLVVDDAIVVLENIHRHIEEGLSPKEAALVGAREIGFAVMAMTATLAAVYAPIGFMTGLTGSLFREFAFTLAGSVIISGIIALTLSPMMCSKMLHHETDRKGLSARIDVLFNQLIELYRKTIRRVLDQKWRVVIIAAVVYLSCYVLYATLNSELAPLEDEGYLMTVAMGPTSANLAYTEQHAKPLEQILAKAPDMQHAILVNGMPSVNMAMAFLILKPFSDRKYKLDTILGMLIPQGMGIPGMRVFSLNPSALPGAASDEPVNFVLKTMHSYEELGQAMDKLKAAVAKNPRLVNVNSDLKLDKAQVQIDIDRNKASTFGISTATIGDTLGMLLGEPTVTRFVMNGRSYPVIPQLQVDFRRNPAELEQINLRTDTGALIPLSNLVTVREIVGPKSLNHFQQQRSATLTASLAPGYTMGQAIDFLKKISKEILPDSVEYDFTGQMRQFVQASGSMMVTFGFAVLFIFLVLAAQFESFRDPLIVMITVPLAIAGGLLFIHITGGTVNIYTQIGLVTLIGLITKHGILIVEFANQLQEKGLDIKHAVIESAAMRLRPILMTTGAMVLGVLPLALASGAGAAARSQIGWVLVGGLLLGTLLTLFVIPVAYLMIAKPRKVEQVL